MILQLLHNLGRKARAQCGSRHTQRTGRVGPVTHVRPYLECLEDRVVPSLTPVFAPAGYPYTAVAEVQVTFPNNTTAFGSGALIDSFHLLTAAHVLYNPYEGGWATSVTVIPARNGFSAPYGVAYGTYERVDPSWRGVAFPSVEDIGLVTLNTPIGNRTGWFSFGWNSDPFFILGTRTRGGGFSFKDILGFTNPYFATAGYPAIYPYNGLQMYYSYGRLTGVQGNVLLSTEGNITNIPGQSGSPLWYTGNHVIYGVNSAWNGSTAPDAQDYFARITPSVFNELQSWRYSDAMPTGTGTLPLRHPLTLFTTPLTGSLISLTAGMAATAAPEVGGLVNTVLADPSLPAGSGPSATIPRVSVRVFSDTAAQGSEHHRASPADPDSPPGPLVTGSMGQDGFDQFYVPEAVAARQLVDIALADWSPVSEDFNYRV
jgi:V8-like Glu-specific endopeptidase